MVRFAGLEADRAVTEDLQTRFPMSKVVDVVATSAEEACEALSWPADVVVLASSGWTKKTWGTAKRPWPGGRWFAGGRSPRTAGMSLSELDAGVRAQGGFKAPLVVIAAGHATASRGVLRELGQAGGGTSRVLLQVPARRGAIELSEIEELAERFDHNRKEPRRAARGLKRYAPA